jgi:serine protease
VINNAGAPGAPSEEWRRSERLRWKVLDPAGQPRGEGFDDEPPVGVYSTVYVSDELIIRGTSRDEILSRIGGLAPIAERAGWRIDDRPLEDDREQSDDTSLRARLSVRRNEGEGATTAMTPDAWEVLRQARANGDGSADGVSLNHVLTTDSYGLNPFTANPFTANPFTANPFTANPFTANAPGVGVGSYGALGFGGRQPVTYLGRTPMPGRVAQRPVVAVFDTGLGEHPWFRGRARLTPKLPNGDSIGIDRTDTDPEAHPSLNTPLDGIFDDASGHGTFIAGIIRQECPAARILPVRVADSDGIILETELIGALRRLIQYITPTTPVHVLNLSFSFYHETPDDPRAISEITDLLKTLRDDHDVVIVCSAGNEATDRRTYPAGLPDKGDRHLAVGALNPSDNSVALFSNIGSWVDIYAPGVSLVSTVPVKFNGGIQAGTRDDKVGRRRETLDADDFRGGFGVWSGTSFAAPVVAGAIAARIAGGSSPDGAVSTVRAQLTARDLSSRPDPPRIIAT